MLERRRRNVAHRLLISDRARWTVIGVAISTDIWRRVRRWSLKRHTAQLREYWTCQVLVLYVQVPAPKSGTLDPVETNQGLRDRASLSWRYEGPIREIACSSPSGQEQPPGRPNLPCRWAFGGRLDDYDRARLQG